MKNTICLLALAVLLLTPSAARAQKKWNLWLPQYTMEAVKGSRELRNPFNVKEIDQILPNIDTLKTTEQVIADDRADYVEDMYIINVMGISIPDDAFDLTKLYDGTDVISQGEYLYRMNKSAHEVLLVAEIFFTHNKRILMRFSDCYDYKDSIITNDPKDEIWQVVDHLQPSLKLTPLFYTPDGQRYLSRDSVARYSTVSDIFFKRFRKVLRFSTGRTLAHRIVTDMILSKRYFIDKNKVKKSRYNRLIASHKNAIMDCEIELENLKKLRSQTTELENLRTIDNSMDSLLRVRAKHEKKVERYSKTVARCNKRIDKYEDMYTLRRFQHIEVNGAYRNSELNVFGNLNGHIDNKTLSLFGTPGDGLHKKIALRLMQGVAGRLEKLGTVEFNFVPYYGHTVRKKGNMVVIVGSADGQEVNLDETPVGY